MNGRLSFAIRHSQFAIFCTALDLAVTYSISAYNACYRALARRLDVPLVTSDSKLAAAVADPTQVRLLSDIQFP